MVKMKIKDDDEKRKRMKLKMLLTKKWRDGRYNNASEEVRLKGDGKRTKKKKNVSPRYSSQKREKKTEFAGRLIL